MKDIPNIQIRTGENVQGGLRIWLRKPNAEDKLNTYRWFELENSMESFLVSIVHLSERAEFEMRISDNNRNRRFGVWGNFSMIKDKTDAELIADVERHIRFDQEIYALEKKREVWTEPKPTPKGRMTRHEAYNILTQHLSDLNNNDVGELQEVSDAVELLDDLARIATHEEIETAKEQGIERPVVPEGVCWNCKGRPEYKPKCPFCKEVKP